MLNNKGEYNGPLIKVNIQLKQEFEKNQNKI